jgi:hypothetical protein
VERKYVVFDIPSRKVGLNVLEDIEDEDLDEIFDKAIERAKEATSPVDDPLDVFFSFLDEIHLQYIETSIDESFIDAPEIRLSFFKAQL